MLGVLVATLVGLAMVPSPAGADTLDDIRKAGTLRVGMGAMGEKPYIMQNADGTYTGFENEMLVYIIKKIGVPKYEYVNSEWTTMIPGLKAKRWDIIFCAMAVTQERIQGAGINYTRPYYTLYSRIAVPKGSPIRGIKDLKGKTVSAQLGSIDSILAHSLQDQGMVGEVKDFNVLGDTIKAVQNRQVDAVFTDKATFQARQQEVPDLELLDESMNYIPKKEWAEAEAKANYKFGGMAIGVRREDTTLLEAINAALDDMDKDGTRERILRKYNVWDDTQRNVFK
jgi:ABC-type amino acid transport substrate-binding protein